VGLSRGPTDRHVYRALLDHAAKHGTEHPEGIALSMGARDLAVEARVGSRNTVDKAIKRLAEKHGAVEVLKPGYGRRATRFLLKLGSAQECAIKNTVWLKFERPHTQPLALHLGHRQAQRADTGHRSHLQHARAFG
jgi:hypothetical protein